MLTVAPGFVRTGRVANTFDVTEVEKLVISRTPMKRYGEAEQSGRFVAFLATDKAGFVTGETLVIDGGQRSLL